MSSDASKSTAVPGDDEVRGRRRRIADRQTLKSTRLLPPNAQPAPAAPTGDSPPMVYAGVAVVLTLIGVAVLVIFGYALFSFLNGPAEGPEIVIGGAVAAPIDAAAPAERVKAPLPGPTPDPGLGRLVALQRSETEPFNGGPTPTPVPGAAPQLLTDSEVNFSSAQGSWQYLWSVPGSGEWTPLRYESREYGTCWYAADYVRICEGSGHPGNGADIGWRWTSPVTGPVEVLIKASKVDPGGDGVLVAVYHNTPDTSSQPVFSRQLLGEDDTGFANRFIIPQVKVGEYLLFVLSKNEDGTFDHTFFQATICHYNCP